MTASSFSRARVLALELATGAVEEPSGHAPVPAPRRAHVVVRLHGHPIGGLDVSLDDIADLCEEAARSLRAEIVEHLQRDGVEAGDRPLLEAVRAASCADDITRAPEPAPSITVAVATLRNPIAAVQTVEQILRSPYAPFDVVVVDNDDDHGAVASAFSERFADDPRVRWVHEPRRGLSVARNRGLREAVGEIVVFTDDDVVADPTWLPAIARAFCADPEVACVSGAIVAAEMETPAQGWLEQYGGFNKGFSRQVYDLGDHRRDTPLYPYDAGRFGSGANTAFRTAVLRGMGGFSEVLGAGTPTHGGEDIDVLRRVVTSGHRLVYEPAALVWHHHRRSYDALRRQLFRYGVGFSATVTKWLVEDRDVAQDVVRRLPAGFRHVLHASSTKNEHKTAFYPSQLTWLERLGMLVGPIAYFRSRRRAR